MAQSEQRKTCIFFLNQMYIDVRAQMGRVKSVHLGQRTSFLITAISMSHTEREFQQRVKANDMPMLFAQWVQRRGQVHEQE